MNWLIEKPSGHLAVVVCLDVILLSCVSLPAVRPMHYYPLDCQGQSNLNPQQKERWCAVSH